MTQLANPQTLGPHMGTSSLPGRSTSHPAYYPGKAVEEGLETWDPMLVWETRKWIGSVSAV